MRKIYSGQGYEVWQCYDNTAKVYELFASDTGEDYIGCADNTADAYRVALAWVTERLNEC